MVAKHVRYGVILLSLLLLTAGCQPGELRTTPTPTIIQLDWYVTSATTALAQELLPRYVRQDDFFLIDIHESTWLGLQQSLAADPTAFGLTTYMEDDSDLWAAQIGSDGIAVITDQQLNVPRLTATQLRGIFTGRITNWREVGGDNIPITVVSLPPEEDSARAFQRMVLGERGVTLGARLAPTSAAVLDMVATIRGAVGYVSFALVDQRVRVIPLAATDATPPVAPSLFTIANESYPLRTPLLLVGQAPPPRQSIVYQFFVWLQQGDGQQVVGRRYVPLPSP